jgi:hypothetical protein
MLVNAEGLPIESIDRISLTLNPLLVPFLNWDNRNKINKYLKIKYVSFYGLHYYLEMQAQFIYQYPDVKLSVAAAILNLLENQFIDFSFPDWMIYNNLNLFVKEIKEIEFAFDFEPEAIKILEPDKLIHYKSTLYSTDRRTYYNKPARKSILKNYDRIERLKQDNHIKWDRIENNFYSQRIEFRLTKNNSPYRTINNISGTAKSVIERYAPYLAIVYHNYFFENVAVDTKEHPHFETIYRMAKEGRSRYTGDLEKMVPYKPSNEELLFFRIQSFFKWMRTGFSIEMMVVLALQNS